MMNAKQAVSIDYINDKTHHELHLPLSVFKRPTNQKEYDYIESVLDQIIDEVRDDEEHPLAIAAQIIGDNLEEYDDEFHQPIGKGVSEIDFIKHLMKERQLNQNDLVDVFGNQGNVSRFLNGQRPLSKTQINKLVSRFHISADYFFNKR